MDGGEVPLNFGFVVVIPVDDLSLDVDEVEIAA